jgi:hypothetical protein
MNDKYIAFNYEANEYETFETFEEAEKWLRDDYSEYVSTEGYSPEVCNGGDYIAEIIAKSEYVITDKKENYCKHDECPNNNCTKNNDTCKLELWPYNSSFDSVGQIEFKREKIYTK